jgi:hypothetical protein
LKTNFVNLFPSTLHLPGVFANGVENPPCKH